MAPERKLERGSEQWLYLQEESGPSPELDSEQERPARKRHRVGTPIPEPWEPVDAIAGDSEMLPIEIPSDEDEIPTLVYPAGKLDVYLRAPAKRHLWCIDSSLVCKASRTLAYYIEPLLKSGRLKRSGGLSVIQLPTKIQKVIGVTEATAENGKVTFKLETFPVSVQRNRIRALLNFIHLGTFELEGETSFRAAVEMWDIGRELECEALTKRARQEIKTLTQNVVHRHLNPDSLTAEEAVVQLRDLASFVQSLAGERLWLPSHAPLREKMQKAARRMKPALLEFFPYRGWVTGATERLQFLNGLAEEQ